MFRLHIFAIASIYIIPNYRARLFSIETTFCLDNAQLQNNNHKVGNNDNPSGLALPGKPPGIEEKDCSGITKNTFFSNNAPCKHKIYK
jgi:hypothetical protein